MNRTELDELPPVLDVPTATILHRAFRDAVRWNLLIRNPCDLADPPRARPAEQVRERTWTSGDVARFLRLTSSSRYSALWRLIAATGMRRGEALGLGWDDVDLAAGRLSINRTLVQSHDYASGDTWLSWGTPKTARGRRAISLDPDTVAGLGAHRKAQLAERLRAGDDYAANDLVFCTGSGEPLHPKIASNLFRKAVIQHDMPKLSVHGLRHAGPPGGSPPQDRPGAARPLHHRDHARHLQPREPRDGRRGRQHRGRAHPRAELNRPGRPGTCR